MPATLTWEGLLLLFRRKLNQLLRLNVIKEIAIAYETLPITFNVDETEHDIPVCHCWCLINRDSPLDIFCVKSRLHALGMMVIDDECEISLEYSEGMRDLIQRWQDTKCIRWNIMNTGGSVSFVRVPFDWHYDISEYIGGK